MNDLVNQPGAAPKALTTLKVSVRDVVEIAVTMEREGARFYQRLADAMEDPKLRKLFLGLMGMEQRHEQKMRELLSALPAGEGEALETDVTVIGEDYFHQLGEAAARKAFPAGGRFQARVEKFEKPVDAFPMALQAEAFSIKLYRFLKRYQLTAKAAKMVDQIIEDETRHQQEVGKILRLAKQG